MNALIVDTLPPETQAGLEALGLDVRADPTIGSHDLSGAIGDVDILVVGDTRVTRRTVEAAPRLKLIVRAGSGVDPIDVAAASERGVFVAHCASAGAAARAEHVIGLTLALDRGLTQPATPTDAAGLRDRRLGIYGWDATAAELRRAAEGLGMRVHAFDPTLTTARASELGVHLADTADALFARCDVVSLHPRADDASVVATAARMASMPAGATLINITRRGLIDLTAARDRLAAGTLKLGLDVYDAEDYGDDVPFTADAFGGRVLATTKIAGRTEQALDATASAVVSLVEAFVLTGTVPDCVNLEALPGRAVAATLTIHYRPGHVALASVFEALRDAGLQPLSIDTGRFSGGASAFARVSVDGAPTRALETAILRHPDVIRLDVVA